MVREFEGKSEKEAIDKAIESLGLDRDEFDVEIVESQKSGLFFRKGKVVIRVHVEEDEDGTITFDPRNDFEHGMLDFVTNLIEHMGYSASVQISMRDENKLCLRIDSDSSSILIGKKGKNLDAIQLVANVVAGKLGHEEIKVVLDAENYRSRRESMLVRMAKQAGEQVRASRGSRLLEPMNPFERRLVHTAISQFEDLDTKSEGEGLYKQVRIIYRPMN